jgi:hypothetical protein
MSGLKQFETALDLMGGFKPPLLGPHRVRPVELGIRVNLWPMIV